MEDGILNFQSIIISLSISLIGAGVIGYILLPFCLRKTGVQRSLIEIISSLSVFLLFVIIFTFHRKM